MNGVYLKVLPFVYRMVFLCTSLRDKLFVLFTFLHEKKKSPIYIAHAFLVRDSRCRKEKIRGPEKGRKKRARQRE